MFIKNDANQSNNLKVIRDLVITQSDEFEIFNDNHDQKRPITFKIYGLEIWNLVDYLGMWQKSFVQKMMLIKALSLKLLGI